MLSGKVMVITGTRKGIGRYLVDYYLNQGFQIIGCSRGDFEEKLDNYEHFSLDVGDEKAVQKMVFEIGRKYKKVDVLLNNAGIASMNHSLLTPKSTIDKIFSTNVVGTFLFSREVAKKMVRKKTGRIVNFATVATPLRLEGEAIYAASKAAVSSLTQVMAKELASYNITVNAVGPTPVATDLIKNVDQGKMDALIGQQAVKRLGVFGDISNVIDFLISERSDFVTGQVIYLGGVCN